jgi:hypothetical protein
MRVIAAEDHRREFEQRRPLRGRDGPVRKAHLPFRAVPFAGDRVIPSADDIWTLRW